MKFGHSGTTRRPRMRIESGEEIGIEEWKMIWTGGGKLLARQSSLGLEQQTRVTETQAMSE